jgi:hypothetical protein
MDTPAPPPIKAVAAPPGIPPASSARQRIRDTYQPMEGSVGLLSAAEALLKNPGRIVYGLQQGESRVLFWSLLAMAVLCLAAYGMTMGMYAWGNNLWISPLKLTFGQLLSALICLPSLMIFSCLSGTDLSLRHVCAILVAALTLTALLLVGFAPVSWIFTQSTESVWFMGLLHLVFWGIAIYYGLRFLVVSLSFLNHGERSGHLLTWCVIFVLVSLQMSTTLRPLVGESEIQLHTEKRFFLTHWMKNLEADMD